MLKLLARCALLSLALLPCAAAAEPIKLKMAYFSSDRSTTYLAAIKPFVDAVNAEAAGLVQIDVGFSGTLGRDPAQQLQLVLEGTADLAFVVPGYTPARFPDNTIIELPGLFSGIREATLVYTSLIAAGELRGYTTCSWSGRSPPSRRRFTRGRPPPRSRRSKACRIRANNPVQGAALAGLGMVPVQMPINQAASAISGGRLDGSMVGPAPLMEFGIARVAPNHYLLGVSSAPLLVVMNRKKLESSPSRPGRSSAISAADGRRSITSRPTRRKTMKRSTASGATRTARSWSPRRPTSNAPAPCSGRRSKPGRRPTRAIASCWRGRRLSSTDFAPAP